MLSYLNMRRTRPAFYFGVRAQLILAFTVFAALTIILTAAVFYTALQERAWQLSQSGNQTQQSFALIEGQITEEFWQVVGTNIVPFAMVLLIAGIAGAFFGFFYSRPISTMVEAIRAVNLSGHDGHAARPHLVRSLAPYVRDEFDELVDSFNTLYDEVDTHTKKLRGLVNERTKALTRSNEILRDFVYYTAHRLRTPLNVMRWSTDIIKNEEAGRLNSHQRELLSSLEQALVSVIELTDDLQDSLVMERRDQVTLKTELVDLCDVIDQAAGEVAVLAREKNVRIEWKHPKKDCAHSYIDRDRITQALKNILQNAILYNVVDGLVSVHIEKADRLAPLPICREFNLPGTRGSYVYIEISDTGIGIPASERSYVFERFFRGRQARTRWVDGGGIGLSVSRPIIRLHGGALWFAPNTSGKGTIFTFSLPLESSGKTHSGNRKRMVL